METNEIKILLGNSIEEAEVDMDAKREERDFPYQESALEDYYFSMIINNIGKEEFKENYLIAKSNIINYSTKDKIKLSVYIINQINEVYDFELPKYLYPVNKEEIIILFEFLEFLEYDNRSFITEIWYYIDVEKITNIDKICIEKEDKIMLEIEEQLDVQYFSKMTTYFLRTYTKDKLIKWFCEKSKKLKTAILLTIRREN